MTMSRLMRALLLSLGLAFATTNASAQTLPATGTTMIGVVDNNILAITWTSSQCFFTFIQQGNTLTANRTVTGTSGADTIIVLTSTAFPPCFGATMTPMFTGSFTLTINAVGGADFLNTATTPRVTWNGGDGADHFCGNGGAVTTMNGGAGADNRCGTGGTTTSIFSNNCPC